MTAVFAWVALALGLQMAAWLEQPLLGSTSSLAEKTQEELVFGTIRNISPASFSLCLRTCVRVLQQVPPEWEGKRAWAEGRRELNFLLPKSKNAVDVIG